MADGWAGEFVALDLETTGLFAESDRVVEIGAVRFDRSGTELASYERLVHPGRPMSPAAQAIHGISDADLADAAPASVVLPEFLAFLGDPESTRLLAHNASFDAGFLGRELGRLGLPLPAHTFLDTLALARRCWPSMTDHRLDTLAGHLGISLDGRHRALADSRRVMRLWLALTADGPPETTVCYPIFDPRRPLPPPEGWDLLSDAIRQGFRVRIRYEGGSRGPLPREITPRRFTLRGGVAYVVAYCHLDAFEKSFRLDRVRQYEVLATAGGTSISRPSRLESPDLPG